MPMFMESSNVAAFQQVEVEVLEDNPLLNKLFYLIS